MCVGYTESLQEHIAGCCVATGVLHNTHTHTSHTEILQVDIPVPKREGTSVCHVLILMEKVVENTTKITPQL